MITFLRRSAVSTGFATAVVCFAASPAIAQRTQPRIVPNPGDPRMVDATSALPLVGELVGYLPEEFIQEVTSLFGGGI